MHTHEETTPGLNLCLIPPTMVLKSGKGDGETCACASSVVTLALGHTFTDRDETICPVIRRLVFELNDFDAWWGETAAEQVANRTSALMPRGEDGCVRADAFIARLAFTAVSPDVEAWRLCVALHRSLCVWLPTALDSAVTTCDGNPLPERATTLRQHAATLREFTIDRFRREPAALAALAVRAAINGRVALAGRVDLAGLAGRAALAALNGNAALNDRAAIDELAVVATLAARAARAATGAGFSARLKARQMLQDLILELCDIREAPPLAAVEP